LAGVLTPELSREFIKVFSITHITNIALQLLQPVADCDAKKLWWQNRLYTMLHPKKKPD
jgi:hypothetical protein